jgi:hypothetical protein
MVRCEVSDVKVKSEILLALKKLLVELVDLQIIAEQNRKMKVTGLNMFTKCLSTVTVMTRTETLLHIQDFLSSDFA